MWKKTGSKTLLFLFITIILAPNIFSVGLGVSPAKLTFEDVLKGGYAQDTLYISTDTTKNLSMFFEMRGEIADWIRVENNLTNITVSQGSPKRVKVIIEPPIDAANGNYTGDLRIITDKIMDPQTGVGSSVKAAFMIKIIVSVTGDEIRACSGGGVFVSDFEIGFPLILSLTLRNDGNVRISPSINLDVFDKYQSQIVYSQLFSPQNILPTESVRITREFSAKLKEEEQYWAQVSVPDCNIGTTLSFDILEKGGVTDKGEFVRIENDARIETGEIIPITAVFKNTGPRLVTARFKGEIADSTGKIVTVIDTDGLDVPSGEVVRLQSFFRPKSPGQYFVRGRIYFNNKLTGEKGSVINVSGEEITLFSGVNYAVWYILILFAIIFLVLMILIKKKKGVKRKRKKPKKRRKHKK